MTHSFERAIAGYHLHGTYGFEPAEPADDTSPGWPAQAHIEEIFINGSPSNAYEILDPALIQMLERSLAQEGAYRAEDERLTPA